MMDENILEGYKQIDEFWDIVKPEKGYLEIRVLPQCEDWQTKKLFYTHLKNLSDLTGVKTNNLTQLFVKDKDKIKAVCFHPTIYYNSKVCYGVNERVEKNGEIAGSREHINEVRFIYFDLELSNHGDGENMQWLLDEFTKLSVKLIDELYDLKYPTIINSGAGRHLLYKIKPQKLTEGKWLWLKQFGEEVSNKITTSKLCIDSIYDPTRILGLPGLWNYKRGKMVTLQTKSLYVNDFKLHSLKKKKIKIEEIDADNLPKPEDSVEWKILSNPRCPVGDINNTVMFSFKLLLKAHGLVNKDDYKKYQDGINKAWKSRLRLNPLQGTDGKSYNYGVVVNWCNNHKDWCEGEGIWQLLRKNDIGKKLNQK